MYRSSEAVIERRQQDRMLNAICAKGSLGCELRDLYCQMHITAKVVRQIEQNLVRTG